MENCKRFAKFRKIFVVCLFRSESDKYDIKFSSLSFYLGIMDIFRKVSYTGMYNLVHVFSNILRKGLITKQLC